MSPLEIEILFHYWTAPDDYRGGDFTAPAVAEAIDKFVRDDMLEHCNSGRRQFDISMRGFAFVDYVCRLPLPEKKWSMSDSVITK